MSIVRSARNRHARIFDLLLQSNRQTSTAHRAALVRGRYIDDVTEAHLLQVCHNSLLGSQAARSQQPDTYRRPLAQATSSKAPDREVLHTHTLLALI